MLAGPDPAEARHRIDAERARHQLAARAPGIRLPPLAALALVDGDERVRAEARPAPVVIEFEIRGDALPRPRRIAAEEEQAEEGRVGRLDLPAKLPGLGQGGGGGGSGRGLGAEQGGKDGGECKPARKFPCLLRQERRSGVAAVSGPL
jgi:hypothetical protein